MSSNIDNYAPEENIVIEFCEVTDIDAVISALKLILSGASILIILSLSHPYGVNKDIISYEKAMKYLIDNNVDLKDYDTEFNKLVPNDTTGYSYSTEYDRLETTKYIVYMFKSLFEKYKKSDKQQFFIRYESDEGIPFINQRNPFGFIWKGEHKFVLDILNNLNIKVTEMPVINNSPNFKDFRQIYLHLSGSCSVMNIDPLFVYKIFEDYSKIKMLSIMGGVDSIDQPRTLKIPGIVRGPFSTMNQCYSSSSFEKLVEIVSNIDTIQKVVITNNIVNQIASYVDLDKESFINFIIVGVLKLELNLQNNIDTMLYELINNYYQEDKKFLWKLFDAVSAKPIYDDIKNNRNTVLVPNARLFTEGNYGNTIVDKYSVNNLEQKLLIIDKKIDDGFIVDVHVPSYDVNDWFMDI